MQAGTSLLRFKRAMVDALTTRVANVVYASPTDAEALVGEDGSGLAVWWGDDAEAAIDLTVLVGGDKWYDERVTCTLILQAIGNDTDDTQEVLDERLTNALGEAIGVIASDPTLGITDDEIDFFESMPVSWTNPTGALGTRRAGRIELAIRLHARIKVT